MQPMITLRHYQNNTAGGKRRILTQEGVRGRFNLVIVEVDHVKTKTVGVRGLVDAQTHRGQTLIAVADKVEVVHRGGH